MMFYHKNFLTIYSADTDVENRMKYFGIPVPSKDNQTIPADIYLSQSKVNNNNGSSYYIVCANAWINPKGCRLWYAEIKNPNAEKFKDFREHLLETTNEVKQEEYQLLVMIEVIKAVDGFLRNRYPTQYLALLAGFGNEIQQMN